MSITLLGLIAGALTSVAGIPQVIRVYRTRQVRDLSVWQPVLLSIGITLWLIYGIIINDLPLIVADIVSLVCSLMLLVMIFRYRDDKVKFHDYISVTLFRKRRKHATISSGMGNGCDAGGPVGVRVQHHAGQRGAGVCSVG